MIREASLGCWLSAASTVFAAVAAIATIVAVLYARKTVKESRAATTAEADQHREQIAEGKPRRRPPTPRPRRKCWNAGSRSTTT
jgi:hypothetical protein